jgi:hypothetical protein
MDNSVIDQLRMFRKDIKNLKEEPYRLENIYSVELAELVSTLCKDMDVIVWVESQTKKYLYGYAHALLTSKALIKLEEIIDDYLFSDIDDNYYM